MENEEFQDGVIELATLNNILLQILLFKQKSLVEDIIPTREGVLMFVEGLVHGYPEDEAVHILEYINSIESFSDKALSEILGDVSEGKSNKPKVIRFC
jgi:hypothetical protein